MFHRSVAYRALVRGVLSVVALQSAGCASSGDSQPNAAVIAGSSREMLPAANQLRELRIDPDSLAEPELLGALCVRYSSTKSAIDAGAADDDHLVGGNRFPLERVRSVLDLYRAAFKKPCIDRGTGRQGVDPKTGEPVFEDRDAEIRENLGGALRRFRGGGRAGTLDPVQFRRYVERTSSESAALGHLDAMQQFFQQLHLLGLGTREEEDCRRTNIGRVCPNGLRVQQLEEAIMAAPEETLF